MAELLVCVVSKTHHDPYFDCKRPKAGDVIVVMPDGHEWGRAEIENQDWKIVRVPGVSVDQASVFTSPEIDDDPSQPSRVLQYRAFAFDMTAEPQNYAELMDAQIRKSKLHDPNVMH